MSDIYANVPDTTETLMARINEVQEAIWTVERAGASPELTAAVQALGEREKALRVRLTTLPTPLTVEQRLLRIERALEHAAIPAPAMP